MLKQLYYGSLQDHMRTSRREMNQSYVLQQQQLMRMNVMRESQRMMLTQAETLVRLNQLRDEVIKALPPKNNTVEEQRYAGILQAPPVIPTSNAALEETLSSAKQPQTQVTMEEEVEGKRAPPTKARSAPASLAGSPKQRNLMVEVEQAVKSGLSPRQVKAAADAAKAAKAANKPSPTFSDTPTDISQGMASAELAQVLENLKAQASAMDKKRGFGLPTGTPSLNTFNSVGGATSRRTFSDASLQRAIDRARQYIAAVGPLLEAETEIGGEGLKRQRAKSGRFVKSKR